MVSLLLPAEFRRQWRCTSAVVNNAGEIPLFFMGRFDQRVALDRHDCLLHWWRVFFWSPWRKFLRIRKRATLSRGHWHAMHGGMSYSGHIDTRNGFVGDCSLSWLIHERNYILFCWFGMIDWENAYSLLTVGTVWMDQLTW